MSETLVKIVRKDDVEELARRGIALEEASRQYDLLRESSPIVQRLGRPARVGDGIRRLSGHAVTELVDVAERARRGGRVSKFVPASGAASRMFQQLTAAVEAYERGDACAADSPDVQRFFEELPRFAFHRELVFNGVHAGLDGRGRIEALGRVLRDDALGYAGKPKGLIAFHAYGEEWRSAFEEQLVEAGRYATDDRRRCRVHFTIPAGTTGDFEWLLETRRAAIEARAGGTLDVSFSTQKPSTDTIAINPEGGIFRDAEGRMLFRPGGHGALLTNLQDIDGDIVVVKNIDNVVPEARMGAIVFWKKVLIGYLVSLQEAVHDYLRTIDEDGRDDAMLNQALDFAFEQLSIHEARDVKESDVGAKRSFLKRMLDRPMRVCGMVRNEGEPGGGPFWTCGVDGAPRLQIVESAEVDLTSQEQKSIWESSTHFNPVDLVLGLRDWRGNGYSLDMFAEPRAVFRAKKTNGGRELVALERPGLWNGSMAYWNTIFVEVPGSTFAPVKTVFDLLRPEHQP
ncbi:MAG: DUF4301 family protein [Acidobacteria bacterium]|nr:DUF4301 family protein [Acidobacteriota bacterium]